MNTMNAMKTMETTNTMYTMNSLNLVPWTPWLPWILLGQEINTLHHEYKNTQVNKYSSTKGCKYQVHKYTHTQVHMYTSVQVYNYKSTHLLKLIGSQKHKYTSTQNFKHKSCWLWWAPLPAVSTWWFVPFFSLFFFIYKVLDLAFWGIVLGFKALLLNGLLIIVFRKIPKNVNRKIFKPSDFYAFLLFTESAPLGGFSHRVAMSVCLFVCLFAPSDAVFF